MAGQVHLCEVVDDERAKGRFSGGGIAIDPENAAVLHWVLQPFVESFSIQYPVTGTWCPAVTEEVIVVHPGVHTEIFLEIEGALYLG